MGRVFEKIDEKLRSWIEQQQMFFVATAPSSDEGLVNCSPKGLDSFRVLGPTTIGYLDMHGSGIETVAHLRENRRIVIMFCAFEGPPKIVRLHGKGVVHELGCEGFAKLANQFTTNPGARSIIEIELDRICDSCGYGVPRYDFVEQRETLTQYAIKKGPEKLAESKVRNARSLDGLPGLSSKT